MTNRRKILLVSEAPPSSKAGGISQTLANIFQRFDQDELLVLTSEEDVKMHGLDECYKNKILTFRKGIINGFRNRIGVRINSFINKISNLFLQILPIRSFSQIVEWNPDIVIVCPNGVEGVIIGARISKKLNKPFYIYLMDDWFANRTTSWYLGSLQTQMDFLLRDAAGWIMISEYLAEILSKRFEIVPLKTHILHNPVIPWVRDYELLLPRDKVSVAYAGALWPMHLDAFLIFARALARMKSQGNDIELVLYCQQNFWDTNKQLFLNFPVVYGGFVSYDKLNAVLYKSHYLLVCSSFQEQYAPFSKSSVQTKITDYMNTGRTIISIGPEYGACNRFIKKNKVGFTIESNIDEVIVYELGFVFDDVEKENSFATSARNLIFTKYNSVEVERALLFFLGTKSV